MEPQRKRMKYCKREELNASWTVENFSKLEEHCIMSEIFPNSGNGQHQWQLRVYPNGNKTVPNYYTSVFLRLVSCDKSGLVVKYKLNCSSSDGILLTTHDFCKNVFSEKENTWGLTNFIKRHDLISLLKDDVLVVNCCIQWNMVDGDNTSDVQSTFDKYAIQNKLSSNLGLLLKQGSLSDVKLVASDGTEFSAHKCVLAAHSFVFKAMFQEKNQKSKVEIKGFDADTIKSMLEFIYAGKFDDKNWDIEKLIVAADYYAFDSLLNLCEHQLCKQLNVDNAACYLLLADKHNSNVLKIKTRELIKANLVTILKTEGMKNLSLTQPSLFYDTMLAVSK